MVKRKQTNQRRWGLTQEGDGGGQKRTRKEREMVQDLCVLNRAAQSFFHLIFAPPDAQPRHLECVNISLEDLRLTFGNAEHEPLVSLVQDVSVHSLACCKPPSLML